MSDVHMDTLGLAGPCVAQLRGQKRSGAFDAVWLSAMPIDIACNAVMVPGHGAQCGAARSWWLHDFHAPVYAMLGMLATVTIIAQGTSCAVAVTQAFLPIG